MLAVKKILNRFPIVKRHLKECAKPMRLMSRVSDGELALLARFEKHSGKPLNVANPKTFTEKMFVRMLDINRNPPPLLTQLADKRLVRPWVAARIGERFLVKQLWAGRNAWRIPYDRFSNDYVIKTNHGSGQIIVVRGKPDRENIALQASSWLAENFYWTSREGQYWHIKPFILVEEFLDDGMSNGPLDYRFWCFNGKPVMIQVDNTLHSINPFYDTDWKPLDLSYRARFAPCEIARPANLEEMLMVAARLAAGFDFVRVDLYNIKGQVLFGEMTFTPVAGEMNFKPAVWNERLGSMWEMRASAFLNE